MDLAVGLSFPVSRPECFVFCKLTLGADTGIGMTPEELTHNLVLSYSYQRTTSSLIR